MAEPGKPDSKSNLPCSPLGNVSNPLTKTEKHKVFYMTGIVLKLGYATGGHFRATVYNLK